MENNANHHLGADFLYTRESDHQLNG